MSLVYDVHRLVRKTGKISVPEIENLRRAVERYGLPFFFEIVIRHFATRVRVCDRPVASRGRFSGRGRSMGC